MEKHGFELVRQQQIPELNTQALFYRHNTGAQLLSLVNDDENKVFGITFRTPPPDSTGVAHILEHAVLGGSRKYPVKDPFIELSKGSLKTFLNAFTYPDRTCYPVASQNLQDFYNLVDVYLDAVFYPRLTPQALQQEGWHYELESIDSPLVYKGVVFNEMKGAYSSPERVLAEYAQQALFPGHIYGLDAGGHPRHIPELRFEQFIAFHRQHYHPANALIFFCGDDDPERRLLLLEEYLGDFAPRAVAARIPAPPRFAAPRRHLHPYAVGQENQGKSMVTVNWLLEGDLDPQTTLALQILSHLLIGTPASPLRKALIDSGLGEDLAGGGMESELRQLFFSTGLKGVEEGREEQVEALVLETLERLAAEGIEAGAIAAALNTTEFGLRENNTGSYPRGLVLMARSLSGWTYGRDPVVPLAFARPLEAVKERAAGDEPYFELLIRQHLIDNPHRTSVILKPELGLSRREEEEERERLAQIRAGLSRTAQEAIIEENRELRQRQEAPDPPEALATLPRLRLSDLERRVRTIPLEAASCGHVPILYHDLFTNGIVYLDMGFDLHRLPQEYLPLVPLFGRALLETGTDEEDFVRLEQRIGARTGGIWPQELAASQRGRPAAAAWLFLRGKAMAAQTGELLSILREVLLTARLDDRERFLQMALEEKAGEEAGLVHGGAGAVSLRLRAQFEEAAWAREQMEGISYLFFLRQLVQQIEQDWPAVASRLEELRRLLLNRRALLCNATLAGADRPRFEPQLAELIAALPAGEAGEATWTPPYRKTCEGLAVPAKVNYVGKAADLYAAGYQLHGSVNVISRYLRNTWLWDRVRLQGGAYGASCAFDLFSGVFSYASYRDPNLRETLETYDRAGQFLRELELSQEELSRAIIGAIGEMDAYQLPDAKGYTSMVRYLSGVGDGFRQEIRDAVLGTTAADFKRFAEVLDRGGKAGQVVVMGTREALEKAGPPGWLELVEVL